MRWDEKGIDDGATGCRCAGLAAQAPRCQGWKWRKSPAQCAITSSVPISEKYLLARNVLRDNYGKSNTRIAGRVSLGSRRKW